MTSADKKEYFSSSSDFQEIQLMKFPVEPGILLHSKYFIGVNSFM